MHRCRGAVAIIEIVHCNRWPSALQACMGPHHQRTRHFFWEAGLCSFQFQGVLIITTHPRPQACENFRNFAAVHTIAAMFCTRCEVAQFTVGQADAPGAGAKNQASRRAAPRLGPSRVAATAALCRKPGAHWAVRQRASLAAQTQAQAGQIPAAPPPRACRTLPRQTQALRAALAPPES